MAQPRIPIGAHVRRKRLEAGLSQVALARALGISASYLNLIESNKRAIGGTLLLRIAERLGIDLADLSGLREARIIAVIAELMADPLMAGIALPREAIGDLVARFPEAGAALARLQRSHADAMREIELLRHRLKSDPLLSELLHEILNRIAGIKSGAEILHDIPDLTEAERGRFVATINAEARDLVPAAQALVAYFDRTAARERPVSALREVDEALIASDNHFPVLEDAADALRAELAPQGALQAGAVADALERRFGIACRSGHRGDRRGGEGTGGGTLWFAPEMPDASRLFRMLRALATRVAAPALDEAMAGLDLSSDEARDLARRALSSYVAGAAMMPYDAFLGTAEARRYDIDLIARLSGVSFEQAAHRLVTLRRRGSEGVPFGFLRADRSGRLTKRFPLPGLSIPGFGHGCPLWPIYDAFGAAGIVRQVSVFPGGGRFLMVAKAVTKEATGFGTKPLVQSVMLSCDILHADRVVYGDGLDLDAAPVPVGPSCAPCPRLDCAHRQEVPV